MLNFELRAGAEKQHGCRIERRGRCRLQATPFTQLIEMSSKQLLITSFSIYQLSFVYFTFTSTPFNPSLEHLNCFPILFTSETTTQLRNTSRPLLVCLTFRPYTPIHPQHNQGKPGGAKAFRAALAAKADTDNTTFLLVLVMLGRSEKQSSQEKN